MSIERKKTSGKIVKYYAETNKKIIAGKKPNSKVRQVFQV